MKQSDLARDPRQTWNNKIFKLVQLPCYMLKRRAEGRKYSFKQFPYYVHGIKTSSGGLKGIKDMMIFEMTHKKACTNPLALNGILSQVGSVSSVYYD